MPRLDAPRRLGPGKRLSLWLSRRIFGTTLDPALQWAHHTGVFWSTMSAEGTLRLTRHHLPATLRDLVVHRVSVVIGCPWCIDFGAMESLRAGLTPERILAVPSYADSDLFSLLERRAMEFADAATATPPTVTDAQFAELQAELGATGMVELVHLVALENQRSRLNHALGLVAQGFTDTSVCPIPELMRNESSHG